MRRRRRRQPLELEIRHVLMTSDAVSGVWPYSLDLARALSGYGIRTTLAVMGPNPSPSQRREARRVPRLELKACDLALEWMPSPWDELDQAGQWLLSLATKYNPDIVHLNGFALANLPWNCPTMVAAHQDAVTRLRSVEEMDLPGESAEYRRRLCLGLQAADMVVAPSAAYLLDICELFGPFKDERVIYNSSSLSSDLGREAKQPIVLAVSRVWDESKNYPALELCAEGVSWPIEVAGNCGDLPEPKNLRNLGVLSRRELAEQFARASIFAHPALYEPFGLSIVEAAEAGCALVLSDLPSLRELWEGAAIFADPRDPAAFGAAIESLIQNEVLRGVCQEAAQRRSRLYCTDAMASQYVFAYQECRHRAALPHLLQGEVSVL